MAYQNFSEIGAAGTAVTTVAPATASAPRLSALEWSVVALAAKDPISSLRTPGRMAVAMAAVFGDRRRSALADPRLEALRRIAVLSRHQGYTVAPSEIRAFAAAGFSEDHYELVVDSLNAAKRHGGAYA